jgi:hypothetical protein
MSVIFETVIGSALPAAAIVSWRVLPDEYQHVNALQESGTKKRPKMTHLFIDRVIVSCVSAASV